MRARILAAALLMLIGTRAGAQKTPTEAFKPLRDTLTALSVEHFGVKSQTDVWKAMRRGQVIDLYFSRTLSDYPWRPEDVEWFRSLLKDFWPAAFRSYRLGEVFCRNTNLTDLVTPGPGNGDGRPPEYRYAWKKHVTPKRPFIEEIGAVHPKRGLYRRNIALWQSHGLYFDGTFWSWQRTPTFRTIEDLYTQSYVLPFLIPMLENAGAYVMTPRERDTQLREVVCDNDPFYRGGRQTFENSEWSWNFEEELAPRSHGAYKESGSWSTLDGGFADFKLAYSGSDNPFSAGTARMARCVSGRGNSETRWTPVIEERGRYSVYISYKSLPESTRSARYTVHHMGGVTEFAVDQTMGGGTWIYLGTFEFDKGSEGYVTLDNGTPAGRESGGVVTADAVRFGGGIGKVARGAGNAPDSTWKLSGMPSYTEGALYWMQYAGAPQSLWARWDGDYTRDYAGRGAWVKWMKDDLGIPVDLSLAFHSDAGLTPNDSIVGTLAIYTLLEDNSRKYKNGEDRMAARFLGDCIQTELTGMIRRDYDTLWRRRQLWDRSYSECRTTDVPGIILELLSHQNFADMRYGLDPQFRWDVCRCVYKGILKFLSGYYGVGYVVQPMPVKDFSAILSDGRARLSWTPVEDPSDPSAMPDSYIVYTRTDGGGWDEGRPSKGTSIDVSAPRGHIYSYKVVAVNEGGRSFPSEILSVGEPVGSKGKVLIVNNFTRISGPSFFDTPVYAGFDDALDGGVPWGTEINFIGEDYEHRRGSVYVGNNAPGFGGSDCYFAGRTYAGNSFDYPYIHGKALFELGWSFSSCGAGAAGGVAGVSAEGFDAVDLICGKQVSTVVGTGEHGTRFSVFPAQLRSFLGSAVTDGSNLIVSGANIATDAWDSVYDIKDADFASYQRDARKFITDTLGYKWISPRASRDGVVVPMKGRGSMEFRNTRNTSGYCVENPDGIRQSGSGGRLAYKYRSSNVGAAVLYNGSGYRVASYGFPLEALKSEADLKAVLRGALEFFGE